MSLNLIAGAVQADPALVEAVARIATAQTVVMICTILVLLLAVGGALLSYNTMKRLSRTLRALEKVIDELAPRAEPLIDGVTRIAVDASAITEAVRRKTNDLFDTVDEVNERVRELTDAAEHRVRQIGTVLDVVQAEAEEIMLDAAATARGVHEAAHVLREPRQSGRLPNRKAPLDLEEDDDEE